MLAFTRAQVEESARIAKAKRASAEAMLQEVLKTNAENEEIKAARMREQVEEDRRIAQQYRDMIEEKNRMREEDLNRRRCKLEKMRAWAEAIMAPIGEAQSEKWTQLDEKIKKEEQQIREAEERRIAKLQADEASLCLLLRTENLELMEEKKKQDEALHRHTLETGERIKQEVAEFQEYMKRRRQKEAEERRQYGSSLLEQMVILDGEDEMTPVEESLNKDALQAVSTDTSFHSRIMHRLRMSGLPTPRSSR